MSYTLILIVGIIIGLLLWLKYHGHLNLKIPRFNTQSRFSIKGGMWLVSLVTYAIILFLGYIILTDDVWRAWFYPISFFIWTNIILIICIIVWMKDSKFKNSAAIIGCLVIVIIYFHVKKINKYSELPNTKKIEQNQNTYPNVTSTSKSTLVEREFPESGNIQIKKDKPIKASFTPGKTWTVCYLPPNRNYTAGAVYVSALDTSIVFYDTIPSRCQKWGNPRRAEWKRHYQEWLECPPGPYYVYVIGRPSMLFTWHTNK